MRVSMALAASLVLLAYPALAAPVVEMAAAEEAEMALSAAPEALRAGAGVYVLGRDGYEQSRPSSNGFNCLVAREAGGIAPLCYDREGSQTLLQADLFAGLLLRAGKTDAEIEALVAAEYAAGRLAAPRKGGVAYMLSHHFTQPDAAGRQQCVFPPHMMIYAPYATNADIGVPRSAFGSTDQPWILHEGKPNAYVLVVDHHAAAGHAC